MIEEPSRVADATARLARAAGADSVEVLVRRIDRWTAEGGAVGSVELRQRRWQICIHIARDERQVELFLDDPRRASIEREIDAAGLWLSGSSVQRRLGPDRVGRPMRGQPLVRAVRTPSHRRALSEIIATVVHARIPSCSLSSASARSEQRRIALATTEGLRGQYDQREGAVRLGVVCTDASARHEVTRSLHGRIPVPSALRAWVRSAVAEATLRRRVRAPRSGPTDVVLGPSVVAELMGFVASCAILPTLREHGTLLSRRRRRRVASSELSLLDQPTRGEPSRCRPFDDEGTRSRSLAIIDRGVFEDVLTDRYYAERYRETPSGSLSKPYGRPAVIAPTNLSLAPGAGSASDLFGAVRGQGLYVNDVLGLTFDFPDGRFSRSARGISVEAGRLAEPVSGFLLLGSVRDLLNRVVAVGADVTNTGTGAFPSILVRGLEVAS